MDREEESFWQWIERHDKVTHVSRDRSRDYSSAIASTGRNIIEIADKFHLIKNEDRFCKLVSEHYADYRNKVMEKYDTEGSTVQQKTEGTKTPDIYIRKPKEDSRMIMFKEVKELQLKGFKSTAISKKLRIARQTGTKFCKMHELPKRNSKLRNSYFLYDKYIEAGIARGIALKTLYKRYAIWYLKEASSFL